MAVAVAARRARCRCRCSCSCRREQGQETQTSRVDGRAKECCYCLPLRATAAFLELGVEVGAGAGAGTGCSWRTWDMGGTRATRATDQPGGEADGQAEGEIEWCVRNRNVAHRAGTRAAWWERTSSRRNGETRTRTRSEQEQDQARTKTVRRDEQIRAAQSKCLQAKWSRSEGSPNSPEDPEPEDGRDGAAKKQPAQLQGQLQSQLSARDQGEGTGNGGTGGGQGLEVHSGRRKSTEQAAGRGGRARQARQAPPAPAGSARGSAAARDADPRTAQRVGSWALGACLVGNRDAGRDYDGLGRCLGPRGLAGRRYRLVSLRTLACGRARRYEVVLDDTETGRERPLTAARFRRGRRLLPANGWLWRDGDEYCTWNEDFFSRWKPRGRRYDTMDPPGDGDPQLPVWSGL